MVRRSRPWEKPRWRWLLLLGLLGACGPGPREVRPGATAAELLAERPRVLWVAAHGDDELMGSGVLMRACLKEHSPCHFVILTRDRGAECLLPQGCGATEDDLAALRFGEMRRAARSYGATLEEYDFFNAPLPVESFPSRPEIERIWARQGDPAALIARAIRRFQPDVMITLDPYQGFTGHPEHLAVGRFAIAGARQAADAQARSRIFAAEPPHRLSHLLHVQNKYPIMALVGDGNDPKPYHDTLDSDEVCGEDRHGRERSCLELGVAAVFVHASQFDNQRALISAAKLMGTSYLRRVDPWGEEAQALLDELQRDLAERPHPPPGAK